MRWSPVIRAVGALAACLVTACASVPAPTEQMAVSRATIEEAQRAGAPSLASVAFNDAQQKLQAARAAMDAGDNLRAARLAQEAEVDAQVAAAHARATKAEQAHAEVQRSIDALRQELAGRSR